MKGRGLKNLATNNLGETVFDLKDKNNKKNKKNF